MRRRFSDRNAPSTTSGACSPDLMSSLPVISGTWICDHGDIRVSPEGQPSVFDMLRVLGGQKNPKTVWKRLTESHPEVVTKCDHLQFPGAGQRLTPVALTKEDAYYIIGLLPGTVGKQYRENAANLFTAFLHDPEKVVNAAVDRLTEEESKRAEARLKSRRTRNRFTAVLQEHGVERHGFAECTNAVYISLFNMQAQQLKYEIAKQENISIQKVNPRDHLDLEDLTYVETAERVAAGQLRRKNIHGNYSVANEVRKSADYTKKLLDGDIDIPDV